MKQFSKYLFIVAIVALTFLAVASEGRHFGNWSWMWKPSKPLRYETGPTVYALGPKGILANGRFYWIGPILITHSPNAPLPSPGN